MCVAVEVLNLNCRPVWPRTHRDPSASASPSAGIRGMYCCIGWINIFLKESLSTNDSLVPSDTECLCNGHYCHHCYLCNCGWKGSLSPQMSILLLTYITLSLNSVPYLMQATLSSILSE